jgi:methyl-accepting chemotaxis protein
MEREARRGNGAALKKAPSKGAASAPSKRPEGGRDPVIEALHHMQAIVELDSGGDVVEANDTFLRLLGYARAEVLGRPYRAFVDAAHAASREYANAFSDLLEGKAIPPSETAHTTKSGKEVWLLVSYVPVQGDRGRVDRIVVSGPDVTAARAKLSGDMAELQTRIAIMNHTSIISESDLRGRITDINEKFCEVSQFEREELLGQPHSIVRHPDSSKEVFKELWSTIGRGKIFRSVIKNRKKDGSPYYVDAVIAPVLGDNGKPRKYIGVRYDITEQEIERQNMKAVMAAFDSSFAYVEFDPSGAVLSANNIYLNLMGYRSDEVVGKQHRLFVDPVQANSPAYAQFWAELKAGRGQSDTYKRVMKDGRQVWLQAAYAPVTDEKGVVRKIVKIATDVTETKTRNADFEAQITAIKVALAVVEFDLEGNVVGVNDRFLRTVGYTADEVVGRHHRMLVEPAHAASREYQQFWQELAAGKIQTGEYLRIGRGGRRIWLQASYNPILDLDGRVTKVVKYASDVTERIEGQEQLARVFEEVARSSTSLSSSSQELASVSQQMASNAQETSNQAGTVAAAANQMSKSVSTVSTGIEEMNASIREIARNASEANKIAGAAVSAAKTTSETVGKLGGSSNEIGKVIKVITSIAQQTNLLALNATIEAARAGEAGKGFAVVANEVKELAKETARATEDISQKIAMIQGDTERVVQAITEIGTTISKINDIQTTIASAVEEQTATAGGIVRTIADAAKATSQISDNIASVATAAKNTNEGAASTEAAAASLLQMAIGLQRIVGQSPTGSAGTR